MPASFGSRKCSSSSLARNVSALFEGPVGALIDEPLRDANASMSGALFCAIFVDFDNGLGEL
jgi:hypothetical protein